MLPHLYGEKKFTLQLHKMEFLLDENLPLSFVELLQKAGFATGHVRLIGLQGASDFRIAEYAKNHKLVLITKDLEFGSLLLYPKGSHYGVLVLRLPQHFNKEQILRFLMNFLKSANTTILIQHIIVLEVGKYRLRKLP